MLKSIIGLRLLKISSYHHEYLPDDAQSKGSIDELIYDLTFDKGSINIKAPCYAYDNNEHSTSAQSLLGYCIESADFYDDDSVCGIKLIFDNGFHLIIQTRYSDTLYYIDNTSRFFSVTFSSIDGQLYQLA